MNSIFPCWTKNVFFHPFKVNQNQCKMDQNGDKMDQNGGKMGEVIKHAIDAINAIDAIDAILK